MNLPSPLLQAISLAKTTKTREFKRFSHAAIGIRKDGVRVEAVNGWECNRDPHHHAEGRLCRKLDVGSTVFVGRVLRDGRVANSRPCPGCQALMRARGVRKVVYSLTQSEFGVMLFQ